MGTELSKQQQGGEDEDEALDARSTTATTLPLPLVAEKWHDWLQGAESLYIQGRFRAYQKVRAFFCVLCFVFLGAFLVLRI